MKKGAVAKPARTLGRHFPRLSPWALFRRENALLLCAHGESRGKKQVLLQPHLLYNVYKARTAAQRQFTFSVFQCIQWTKSL